MHELPHNHSRNPKHIHPFPCVGPYTNTTTTLDLFLTFLAQWKSSRRDSSHSVFLIKTYFYLSTTPHNQNLTTFFLSSLQIQSISFPFITITPCLHFLNLPQISSSSSHLCASLKSPCQSPSKNLIHRSPKVFSLGCRDCIPSQQLTPLSWPTKQQKHTKK
jgi:hypothetical protein